MKNHLKIMNWVILAAALSTTSSLGDTYTITMGAGAGKDTCGAYNYLDQQIQNAIQNPLNMMNVLVWNSVNQSYDILTYLNGQWDIPTYVLTPGTTMFLRNPSDSTYGLVIAGQPSTTGFYSYDVK